MAFAGCLVVGSASCFCLGFGCRRLGSVCVRMARCFIACGRIDVLAGLARIRLKCLWSLPTFATRCGIVYAPYYQFASHRDIKVLLSS